MPIGNSCFAHGAICPFCKGSASRAKYKTNSFVFISEAPPTIMAVAVKVVQAERNTKQMNLFLFTMSMAPAAVKMLTVLGRAMTSPILKTYLQLAGSRH